MLSSPISVRQKVWNLALRAVDVLRNAKTVPIFLSSFSFYSDMPNCYVVANMLSDR
jgi:hypothetical protein